MNPMENYLFDPDMSFRAVREKMDEMNNPENGHLVAKLTWLEGLKTKESLSFLWDPYAEHFGHQIDKETLDHQVVMSLINGIPVEIQLKETRKKTRKRNG